MARTIAPGVETMAVWHTTASRASRMRASARWSAGASARGAITFIYPQMMNEFLAPSSRSSPAIPAATKSTSRWSAAKSKRATTPGRAGRRPRPTGSRQENHGNRTGRAARAPISMRPRSRMRLAPPRSGSSSSSSCPAPSLAGRSRPTKRRPTASPRSARLRRHHERPGVHCRDQVARFDIDPVLGETMQKIVRRCCRHRRTWRSRPEG